MLIAAEFKYKAVLKRSRRRVQGAGLRLKVLRCQQKLYRTHMLFFVIFFQNHHLSYSERFMFDIQCLYTIAYIFVYFLIFSVPVFTI